MHQEIEGCLEPLKFKHFFINTMIHNFDTALTLMGELFKKCLITSLFSVTLQN